MTLTGVASESPGFTRHPPAPPAKRKQKLPSAAVKPVTRCRPTSHVRRPSASRGCLPAAPAIQAVAWALGLEALVAQRREVPVGAREEPGGRHRAGCGERERCRHSSQDDGPPPPPAATLSLALGRGDERPLERRETHLLVGAHSIAPWNRFVSLRIPRDACWRAAAGEQPSRNAISS